MYYEIKDIVRGSYLRPLLRRKLTPVISASRKIYQSFDNFDTSSLAFEMHVADCLQDN